MLSFSCDDAAASVAVIAAGEPLPGGPSALAAPGDFILRNNEVVAIIDALDHPHFLAPTGGSLLDLGTASGNDDALNLVMHGVGLLPRDAAFYTSARMIAPGAPGQPAALQLRGHLDGQPKNLIATRYELWPCEPGIRIRTEVYNGRAEASAWALFDGYFWGKRENAPFTPTTGRGFEHPDFGLDTVNDVYVDAPFLAANTPAPQSASYATVACNADALSGFHSATVSAAGRERTVVSPRDHVVFERFIAVSRGGALSGATDIALDVRQKLFDESFITVSGKIQNDPSTSSVKTNMTVEFATRESFNGDDWVSFTTTIPGQDDTFSIKVPTSFAYLRAQTRAFGRRGDGLKITAEKLAEQDGDIGTLAAPAAGTVNLRTTLDGNLAPASVTVIPATKQQREEHIATFDGQSPICAPLLGAPQGGSPSCNRVLVNGDAAIAMPPGDYVVYATTGVFNTIATATITVKAGLVTSTTLATRRLALQPPGTLSADFHVHGAPSFDSAIPNVDRALAFLAAGVQVIAATEHNVVFDYREALQKLGASDHLVIIPGTEATGHVLFDFNPEVTYPQVIGHWNIWPLEYDPQGPWRGAPWDQKALPGMLFTRAEDAGWPSETGVVQLNHPWAEAQFGRDLGFPRALRLRADTPIPEHDDGSAAGLFHSTPEGARFANSDFHAQEVMNGTANEHYRSYRAFWFYLLNQGIVRAGTANSDSHSLEDNVLGTPRTLVYTDQTVANFDRVAFDTDVRRGKMVGTNGPVIEAVYTDGGGTAHGPSLGVIAQGDTPMLNVRVSAAPWVPVDEVRVIVNGEVKKTIDNLPIPADPFGSTELQRLDTSIDLAGLLPTDGTDAWVIVEAGAALTNADFEDDGFTLSDSHIAPWADTPSTPDLVSRDESLGRRFHFRAVVPDGYPLSFCNPILLDRDGGGFHP